MDQDIRYCTAPDGVRIAYSTAGSGPPLVVSSAWVGHLEFEWAQPGIRSFWENVARGRTLVRYDKRGTGLSDWDAADQSLEARAGDLERVADALQLSQFDMMGVSEGGATAITYATRHPEKVARLILYGAYPRLEVSPELVAPLLALVRTEWGMGSAALSSLFVPSGDPAEVAEFTALQRVSASGESAVRVLEMIAAIDVTGLLKDVAAPTLVLHRKGDGLHPFDLAREIAATIPNARFISLDGDLYPPWLGDSNAVIRAVHAFLGTEAGVGDVRSAAPSPVTIMFTDMESSTATTQRLGDAAAQDLVRAHNIVVRDALKQHNGNEIKHTGGEILVSGVVRELVAGKGFTFGDRGEFVPKGFDEGVRQWDVRWRE
jgi:pimeloyl-ACP methyl ester carboxylesterase